MSKRRLDVDELGIQSFVTSTPDVVGMEVGAENWTNTCAPDRFTLCGHNVCDPVFPPDSRGC